MPSRPEQPSRRSQDRNNPSEDSDAQNQIDPSEDPDARELQDLPVPNQGSQQENEAEAESLPDGRASNREYDSARSRLSQVPESQVPDIRTPEADGEGSPHIRFSQVGPLSPRRHTRFISMTGVGARDDILNNPAKLRDLSISIRRPATIEREPPILDRALSTSKYFESNGRIARNSQFHSLSVAEREQLGGVELRAIIVLRVIILAYFVLFQLLGCLGIGAWIACNAASTTLENGLNPWCVATYATAFEVLLTRVQVGGCL